MPVASPHHAPFLPPPAPRPPAPQRRPRVLVVSPIYPWPGDPDEGIFVHRQVRTLRRLGYDCRVLTYHGALPGLPAALGRCSWLRYPPRWVTWPPALDGVPVSHVFHPRRRRGEDVVPAIGDALARHIDRHPELGDVDVVYGHWLWSGGAAALELRARFGWPVAAIARGSDMFYWQTVHPHCRPHVERVLAEADLLLANCESLRARAGELLPGAAGRARVVYNGCDATAFRPPADADAVRAARAALGLHPTARYFLCCASLDERKGIAELAQAWRLFARGRPEWRLLVVGRPVRRALADALRAAGRGSVEIVGRVPAHDVVRYLHAADAYVQPSRAEGLANATMEAMACGLPVVSTDANGQRELVRDGENGWLVPARDPAALARAMAALASDADHARRLGARARRTIVDDFDPLVHARGLGALLGAVAGVSPARRRAPRPAASRP